MTPVAPSSGPRAYPDGQRVANIASGVNFAEINVLVGGAHLSPVLDMSNYQYLSGRDLALNGPVLVAVGWFTDIAATQQCGLRRFILDPQLGATAWYHLPNRGPFCRVQWGQIGALGQTHTCNIFGSNVPGALDFCQQNATLIQVLPFAAANNTNNDFFPDDYCAGPARIWVNSAVAGQLLSLMMADITGAYVLFDQVSLPAGNFDWSVVLPPGAWKLQLGVGGAGAGNYYIAAIASATGSS